MSYDPFAEIRCRECGWVHYRELPCPPKLSPWRALISLERIERLIVR